MLIEAFTFKGRFVVADDEKKDVLKLKTWERDKEVSGRRRVRLIAAALGLWAEQIGAITALLVEWSR